MAQVFSVNFLKFLRTPISIEHLWWLLLKVMSYHYTGNVQASSEVAVCLFFYLFHFISKKSVSINFKKKT